MQNEVARLRRKFREGRADLFSGSAKTAPCCELLGQHAALIDGLVEEIHQISCNAADLAVRNARHPVLAIAATGGYGRRELNPLSDVDIAFIPSEEEDPWVEAVVHTAFKLVMDVFLSLREIRVGYSFRPISEVSTWDLSTKTALLDARHICGDRSLTDRLGSHLRSVLSPLDLMLELSAQQFEAPRKSRATLHTVEPNLKEGPGSLRDLHRGRWIFKLLLNVGDNDLWPGLQSRGFVSKSQALEIRQAAEWFWRARNWLHLAGKKKSDVLITNYQDRIAEELGGCSAQEWLSQHFVHAESLWRFRDAAVRALLGGPLDIDEVCLQEGTFHLPAGDEARRSAVAVRMFHLSQRYAIPVSLSDQSQLVDSRERALQVSEPTADEAWAFLGILNGSLQVGMTLRWLAQIGALDRFIGGFSEMMRFVPPDPAHRYTVGEHSLRIVEHLEDLRAGRDPSGQRFSDLLSQCAHFDMLCLAALLHDSGKLKQGTDHSEDAVELTRKVSEKLGLAPEKKEILDILVRQHLLLMRTARLHDLKYAGVIQSVAEKVPSMDALRHLYVFTYVDTRSVAEKSWTSMDFRDLEDLYRKLQNLLSGEAREDVAGSSVENKIGLIRKRLASSDGPFDEEAVQRHCDAMAASYVLNTPLDEIIFHLQLLNRLPEESVVLDVYNRPGDDYSELTVCTYDDPQPGMLAKITGVLYGCSANIHKAQVFTMERERPVVLDTLWVRSDGMQISENRADRIRAALKRVLAGGETVQQFLESVGKQPPKGIPLDSIDLRNDLSEEHSVVHVIARDLQGLLYLMTRALSRCGLHIHSAKVATWSGLAENNFYVTTLTGGQLDDADLPRWKVELARALQGPAE